MDIRVGSEKLSQLTNQRNASLVICIILLFTTMILSISVFNKDTKVILVPGLDRQMEFENGKFSKAYLEEVSYTLLRALLDVTPDNVDYNKKIVSKYSAPEEWAKIENYFDDIKNHYTHLGISSFFSAEELLVGDNVVYAKGILTKRFGKQGNQNHTKNYALRFAVQGSMLKLISFDEVLSEEIK